MIKHDCNKTEVIEMIKDDVSEIKGDVKTLLQAQWKADGRSTVIGFIVSTVVSLAIGYVLYKLNHQ